MTNQHPIPDGHPPPQAQVLSRRDAQSDHPSLYIVISISIMMALTSLSTSFVLSSKVSSSIAGSNSVIYETPDLASLFPETFGDWQRHPLSSAILPPESVMGPGEVVEYRAYRNSLGRLITLVVAYGPPASDSVRLHRPETCYAGQGFLINWQERSALSIAAHSIPINRIIAKSSSQTEAISYWLRAGNDYATSAAAHQWINLQQGLGRTADGILVRISTQGEGAQEFELHARFMEELLQQIPEKKRSLLIAT